MIVSKTNVTIMTILGVYATALAPFVGGDQRNFLVIAVSGLAPVIMVAFRLPLTRDAIWAAALLFYMFFLVLFSGNNGDLTSVFYTGLFILSYLSVVSCLYSGLVSREALIALFKKIILAFGIVSVLQMVTSIAGLPVPNLILSKGLWSYNSLAVEPSHLGRVLPVTMLAYIVLLRTTPGAAASPWQLLWQERIVVGTYLGAILLSGSTLAILAAPVALLFAFPARWILVCSGAVVFAWPMVLLVDIPALQRGLFFLATLPTLDIQALADADHSASLRVAPALIYFSKMNFGSSEFWLGGGVSAIRPFLVGEIKGVGENAGAGFFPSFLIAFGLVGTVGLVTTFVVRFLHPVTLTLVALWLVLFLPSAWNTQLFWYGLMVLRIVHYFEVAQKGVPVNFVEMYRTRPAAVRVPL